MNLFTGHFTEADWKQFAAIWKRIKPEGEHWIWTGITNTGSGLPMISRQGHKGKFINPHRWLYEALVLRPMGFATPERKWIVRTCDTRLCVNPKHHTTKASVRAMRRALKERDSK